MQDKFSFKVLFKNRLTVYREKRNNPIRFLYTINHPQTYNVFAPFFRESKYHPFFAHVASTYFRDHEAYRPEILPPIQLLTNKN